MKKLLYDIVQILDAKTVTFGDVRFTSTDEEVYYFENGSLKTCASQMDQNTIGIRVLADGCWGFAGLNEFSKASIEKAVNRAISDAKHGARFKKTKTFFKPQKAVQASVIYAPSEDPFAMNREEKINFLSRIAEKLKGHDKIVYTGFYCAFARQHKIYMNTEGTVSDFLAYETEPHFTVVSADETGTQSRTYPGDMSARRGGFEIVRAYEFEKNIPNTVKEAVDLLTAPVIEDEKADIILGGSQLALQLHESVGHATEADRIFGMEISYAGKTFVKPEMIGKFQYGSPVVNIVSDSSDPAGIGCHPVDDEGIPGRSMDIIKNGILVGQQTSREIAGLLGMEPSSNMRAVQGFDIPLVRMTNFNLLPGRAGSLDDMIKSTEKGYLLDFTKCWSIDDSRNNFQFTTEIGYVIKEGRITGIVKEPTYYGITREFWNSCDAVCSESEWKYYGTFNCGKGEPGQALHLSHKTAPARFKNVVVNVRA